MTSICVIGDVFDDFVTDLTDNELVDEAIACSHEFDAANGIDHVVGGAGLQFAIAAAHLGAAEVCLIGKVGQGPTYDAAANRAVTELQKFSVRPLLAVDPTLPTGRVMVTYLPRAGRIMVSDVGANGRLCVADINEQMVAAVTRSEILYVSGFALVQESRREATLALVEIAVEKGSCVALDLVPHRLDEYLDVKVITNLLAKVSWVFAAESTARRVLAMPKTDGESALLAALCADQRCGAVFRHPSIALVKYPHGCMEQRFAFGEGAAARGQSAQAHAQVLSYLWR